MAQALGVDEEGQAAGQQAQLRRRRQQPALGVARHRLRPGLARGGVHAWDLGVGQRGQARERGRDRGEEGGEVGRDGAALRGLRAVRLADAGGQRVRLGQGGSKGAASLSVFCSEFTTLSR